jgi:hypothetical protein
LHRMMSMAVSVPISLTSPVAFRANSFFSDIFLRNMLAGDVYLTLYNRKKARTMFGTPLVCITNRICNQYGEFQK